MLPASVSFCLSSCPSSQSGPVLPTCSLPSSTVLEKEGACVSSGRQYPLHREQQKWVWMEVEWQGECGLGHLYILTVGLGEQKAQKVAMGKRKKSDGPQCYLMLQTQEDNQEAQSFPFFSRKTNKNGLQSTWKALQRETLSSPAPVLRTPTILCTSGLTVSHLLCDIRRLILKQITKHGRVTFHCCLIYILIG